MMSLILSITITSNLDKLFTLYMYEVPIFGKGGVFDGDLDWEWGPW